MAFAFALGLTVVAIATVWWQARRLRAPEVRRRRLDDRAARIKLRGYFGVVVVATLARAVAPVCGLSAFGIGLVIVMLGVVVVHLVVRRHDPGVRFWHRPEPLPEARELDVAPAQKPW